MEESHRQEANPQGQGNPQSAAIVTIAVTGIFLIFYLLFWGLGELNIKGTQEAFIDSFGYHLWAAMAALSASLWVVLFKAGLRENDELKQTVSDPWKDDDWKAKGLLYFGFVILGGTLLWAIQKGARPPVPIGWWDPWSYVLVLAGAVAAGPWVFLVWRSHAQLQKVDTGSARRLTY